MPEELSPFNLTGISTSDKETLTISAGDITPAKRFVIVAAQTGVTDFLDGIITSGIQAPGDADGAVIYLMADAGDTITIRHNQNSGATKNVLTSSGASVVMTGNTVIRAILNIDLDTNGAWVVDSGGAGGGVTDHGALDGLSDVADHAYAFLVDGTRALAGDLNHDGSNIGFFGTTPAGQAAAYTPTNDNENRSYDADATTLHELADVLATLISDLKSYGLLQ